MPWMAFSGAPPKLKGGHVPSVPPGCAPAGARVAGAASNLFDCLCIGPRA